MELFVRYDPARPAGHLFKAPAPDGRQEKHALKGGQLRG